MIYETAREYWKTEGHNLLSAPSVRSRAGETREIVGHAFTITNPIACWAGGSRKGNASLGYGFAELLWYLSYSDTMEMLAAYAPSYAKYTNDGRAMGAYGLRWRNNPGIKGKTSAGSLLTAIELLQDNRDDRRAIVTMWDSGDVFEARRGVWKDIPCTLSLQFLVRDGSLHMITTMRSNDFWLGGIYDVFTFCQLQILVAAAMKLAVGEYHHRAGSVHIYEKNVESFMAIGAEDDVVPAMEWVSPEPTHREAFEILYTGPGAPIFMAEELIRRHPDNLFEATSWLPEDYAWSHTCLKSLHYHLTKGKK